MALVLFSMAQLASAAAVAGRQDQPQAAPTFRAGVDLVRIAAVVRDRKGRFVQDLTERDFEILDSGKAQRIVEFRRDLAGVSIALLFDISGSMEGLMPIAREGGSHVLSWLAANDEAAVFTFDTRLDEVAPFTAGLQRLPQNLSSAQPFGATSLHDAIARTAQLVGKREDRRRAVVVLTDGLDTSSRLSPSEVSAIASEIDVPVYIIGVVPSIDDPFSDTATVTPDESALAGSLADLARWTGGHTFVASGPGQRNRVARQIVDELRHQYLIAFESSGRPGWHPLVIRAVGKGLTIRARSGYIAGQSRPKS